MAASAPRPTKLTVLISGSGTNLQALIDATTSVPPALPNTTIIRVISNKAAAYGLQRAAHATPPIPTAYHNLLPYKRSHPDDLQAARERYDADLAQLVLADGPDLVVCAGWMHILAPVFLDALAAAGVPVINLHPALPGAFDGAAAIERAWRAWREGRIDCTGVMVHYVINEVDRGQPILVREIPFRDGEDEDVRRLEERIHEVEHEAIVEGTGIAIRRLWEEREGKGGKE